MSSLDRAVSFAGSPKRARFFMSGPYRADFCTKRIAAAPAGDPVVHGIDPLLERPSPRERQRRLLVRVQAFKWNCDVSAKKGK